MSALPLGEISPFTIAVAVLSGFVILFGYVSMFIKERLLISEAFLAVVVGIVVGPLCANVIDPFHWTDTDIFTKELTRVTIAIQVMAVGISLPSRYMWREFRSMFIFLFPVMSYMWIVSAAAIYLLVPPLTFVESLAIAACITPTDPILANSVVKGRFAEKHVPTHVQNILSAESGANDGMGFPFLYLALYLLHDPGSPGEDVGKWFYLTWLYQILLSCVIGALVGYAARRILQLAEQRKLIDKPSFLVFAIALALLIMSLVGMTGSDDLLACFVAGNAVSWDDWFRRETEEAHIQEVIDMLLNLAVFVYIGTIIPWQSFNDPALGLTPWRLVTLAVVILLLRRLPVVVLLQPIIPAMRTYREAAFSGWFGPIGIGAVFLSIVAQDELGSYPNANMISTIQPIVLFIVLSSVLVHGTTIPLFKLGKRIKSRTISITSQNNQVRMLPILQFGQQVEFRRPNAEEGSGIDSGVTTVRDLVQDEGGDSSGIPLYTGQSAEANGYNSSPSEVTIEMTPQDSNQDVVPARETVHTDDSSNQNLPPFSTQSTLTPSLVAPSPTPSSSNAIRIFEEPNARALAVAAAISAQQERERVKEREQSERNENSVRSLRSLFRLGGPAGTSKNENKDAENAENVEENELSLQSLNG